MAARKRGAERRRGRVERGPSAVDEALHDVGGQPSRRPSPPPGRAGIQRLRTRSHSATAATVVIRWHPSVEAIQRHRLQHPSRRSPVLRCAQSAADESMPTATRCAARAAPAPRRSAGHSTSAANASVSASPVSASASNRCRRSGARACAPAPPPPPAAAGARPHQRPSTKRAISQASMPAARDTSEQCDHRHAELTMPACLPCRQYGKTSSVELATTHPGERARPGRPGDRPEVLAARRGGIADGVGDRDGRASRDRVRHRHGDRICVAGGGNGAGRVAAEDLRPSRARLRPRRRARQRLARPAPHPARTDVSFWLSGIGDVYAIPALVAISTIVALVMRKWRVAGFILAAIAVEAATYRAATMLIHRQRPNVPRLDDLPVNASYYSGHTAASVSVYCGLALIVTSRIRSTGLRGRRVAGGDRDPAAGRRLAHVPRHASPHRCRRRSAGRHRNADRGCDCRPRRRRGGRRGRADS